MLCVYNLNCFILGQLIANPKDEIPEEGWGPSFCYYIIPAGGFFDALLDILPLCEYFSTSHTAISNAHMLMYWFEKADVRSGQYRLRVPTFCVDFSWPLISGLLKTFNDQKTRSACSMSAASFTSAIVLICSCCSNSFILCISFQQLPGLDMERYIRWLWPGPTPLKIGCAHVCVPLSQPPGN